MVLLQCHNKNVMINSRSVYREYSHTQYFVRVYARMYHYATISLGSADQARHYIYPL